MRCGYKKQIHAVCFRTSKKSSRAAGIYLNHVSDGTAQQSLGWDVWSRQTIDKNLSEWISRSSVLCLIDSYSHSLSLPPDQPAVALLHLDFSLQKLAASCMEYIIQPHTCMACRQISDMSYSRWCHCTGRLHVTKEAFAAGPVRQPFVACCYTSDLCISSNRLKQRLKLIRELQGRSFLCAFRTWNE